jgi:hypothetical protein
MTLKAFKGQIEAAGGTFRYGMSNRKEDRSMWIGIFARRGGQDVCVIVRDGIVWVAGRSDRLDGIAKGSDPVATAIRRAKTAAYVPALGRD